ncbi:MAG TPA: CDP-2,3-bis-(O-geranylgeranyl)-sn-glycerol synthase [archaeon]|nr:CDP-2,3-bis-(O-geranylgeranyl)-sn-glycerol synthase [archaeon]
MLEVLLAQAFWLVGSAYAANAFPPLIAGHRPLDKGKMFHNRRLLGDGKTIEGTVAGILFGLFYGAVQILVQPYIPLSVGGKDLGLLTITPAIVILLVAGTMIGDIAGSFIKRRVRLERGASAPIMDQLGFVIVALLLVSLVAPISIEIWIILVVLTPVIHWLANLIGYYAMHVKKTPW